MQLVAPLLAAQLLAAVGSIPDAYGAPRPGGSFQGGSRRTLLDRLTQAETQTPAPAPNEERSLRNWSGLGALGKRLDTDPKERKIALARLSERGTPQALRVITQWLEGAVDLDERDWLNVSRALARHAHQPDARRWLMRILSGAPLVSGSKNISEPEVAELSRAIAALALAKVGGEESLRALVTALGQGEHTARWARTALVAHPPRSLEPLLTGSSAARAELVATLDELGDQRSFEALRAMVQAGTAELQARAVLALFHHGQLETVEVARHWAKTATSHAGLLAVASEILLATHLPEAPSAYSALLALDPPTALSLAKRFPTPAIGGALAQRLPNSSHEERLLILEILGASGGPDAIGALAKLLADPTYGVVASQALSSAVDPAATQPLLTALDNPKTEALALRALVARGWQTHQSFAGVAQRLQRFAGSPDAAERALGQWGLAVASKQYASKLIDSDDFTAVAVGLSTLWVHGDALGEQAVLRLPNAKGPQLRVALAMGLGSERAAQSLSSGRLHALLDEVEALAPVVAPWLTERREERFPARIDALLGSTDARVVSAALLGLGANPDPKSDGLLARAYDNAIDVRVRRAAIAASAERARRAGHDRGQPELEPREPLAFAADFDPDPATRELARLTELPPPPKAGTGSLWISRPKTDAGDLVLITARDGRTFHALLPADHVLILLGWPDLEPAVETTDW